MTTKTLVAFLEKVREDEKLRAEFFEFAARHGFPMTPDELTDTQLEAVAGGIIRLRSPAMSENKLV